MKLSARNVLKGRVIEVKKGTTTAHSGWPPATTPMR